MINVKLVHTLGMRIVNNRKRSAKSSDDCEKLKDFDDEISKEREKT